MKWKVPGQEVDQGELGERLYKKTVRHINWTRRMPWMEEADKGWLMTTIGVSGWMFLLVLAHPGCPRQSPESCEMVVVSVVVVVVVACGRGSVLFWQHYDTLCTSLGPMGRQARRCVLCNLAWPLARRGSLQPTGSLALWAGLLGQLGCIDQASWSSGWTQLLPVTVMHISSCNWC